MQRIGRAIKDTEVWYPGNLFAIHLVQETSANDHWGQVHSVIAMFNIVRPLILPNPFHPNHRALVGDAYTVTSSILVQNNSNLLLLSFAQTRVGLRQTASKLDSRLLSALSYHCVGLDGPRDIRGA